jgi:phosphoribosylformylglycinamidine cyclo-ligase
MRPPESPKKKGAYAEAGVNIDAGTEAVKLMREAVRSTWDAGVLGQYGAFAGLYDTALAGSRGDVLAVTIDGVGTKLKVAVMVGRYASVGMDIVNHCTDDLLVQRARPLLFADYFASSKLAPAIVAEAVGGMAEACRIIGCAIIGGETAEMPGVYREGEIDLVGCMIGLVRKSEITDVPPIAPGDVLIGLASSGLHTNGYSLARHLLFEKASLTISTRVPELACTVGEELLKVHREYLTALEPHLSDKCVHGLAHITGGGLYDNVLRILPDGCRAHIDKGAWKPPPIFRLLQSIGELPDDEAYRALNMGVGMVIVAEPQHAGELVSALKSPDMPAFVLGEVLTGHKGVQIS